MLVVQTKECEVTRTCDVNVCIPAAIYIHMTTATEGILLTSRPPLFTGKFTKVVLSVCHEYMAVRIILKSEMIYSLFMDENNISLISAFPMS